MLTYTNLIDNYKALTKNSESDNITLGDTMLNQGIRKVASKRAWDFLYGSEDDVTVANNQFYNLPWDYKKLQNVTITVGTTKYVPKEAPNREFWDRLNESTTPTSDTPEWFFIQNKQIGFYPTPSTADNTITYNYKKRVSDISVADYTAGSIAVTNDSKTVTGTATTFTASMVGRWLKLDDEGDWYEIGAFTSATVITLVREYEGVTATGASYTLGQVSLLPEDYQILPLHYAVYIYWSTIGDNATKATLHKGFYDESLIEMIDMFASKSDSPVMEDESLMINNPNLFVSK